MESVCYATYIVSYIANLKMRKYFAWTNMCIWVYWRNILYIYNSVYGWCYQQDIYAGGGGEFLALQMENMILKGLWIFGEWARDVWSSRYLDKPYRRRKTWLTFTTLTHQYAQKHQSVEGNRMKFHEIVKSR